MLFRFNALLLFGPSSILASAPNMVGLSCPPQAEPTAFATTSGIALNQSAAYNVSLMADG